MNILSITQKFSLFQIHTHHSLKLSYQDPTISACFLTACFWELLQENVITIDEKKRVILHDGATTSKPYLNDLIRTIHSEKPKKISEWMEFYIFSVSNKLLQTLVEDLLGLLVNEHEVETTFTSGLFGKKKPAYQVNVQTMNSIQETLKAELLKTDPLPANAIILYTLIQRSHMSSQYFSKEEQKQLRRTFKQLKDSDEYKFAKQYIDEIEAIMMLIVMPK